MEIKIRAMDPNDVPKILGFTDSEGWGYDESDIHRIIELSPKGCFLIAEEKKGEELIIGMITSICYGSVGWIGNLLVKRERRKKGIGRVLMDKGITHIQSSGIPTVALHSYMESIEFYDTLGFKRIEKYVRCYLDKPKGEKGSIPKEIQQIDEDLIEQVIGLDTKTYGSDRSGMLRATWRDFPDLSYAWVDKNMELKGFILGRGSEKGYEIGPWICEKECKRPGALVEAVLRTIPGKALELSIREDNKRAKAVLKSRGFAQGYKTMTMYLGTSFEHPRPEDLWAIAALEKG